MIDTHTHYFLKEFDCDRYALLEKLKVNGITRVIEAAIGMESNFLMRKYFSSSDMVYYGAGIHPLRVANADEIYGIDRSRNILRELLSTPKTVALGETGLDYQKGGQTEEERELQIEYFKMQMNLALENDMPLILHNRGCHEEALKILESFNTQFKGVCHCFIGGAEIAKRYTDLGFYLGIGGSCTYSKHREGLEVFIRDLPKLPKDRIVLETDAPYLKPTNCKGGRNTSLNLYAVVKRLAKELNLTEEKIESITEKNAIDCFSLS